MNVIRGRWGVGLANRLKYAHIQVLAENKLKHWLKLFNKTNSSKTSWFQC